MYSAYLAGGGIVGGIHGAVTQHQAAQHDPYAGTPKAYALNTIGNGLQGAAIGSGVYGITQAVAKANVKTAGIMAGVGATIGFAKGVSNQRYALKHYNSPEYGPGAVDDSAGAYIGNGLRTSAKFAMFGLGAYGALDVASSILRKSL